MDGQGSVLHLTRSLLALRNREPALRLGRPTAGKARCSICAASTGGERVRCLFNLGEQPTKLDPAAQVPVLCPINDVAERDARNRALGKAGEEIVLRHEQSTLRQTGREDLADRVRWTAVQDGDGYGYDIASFEPDGRERLIEVKTTNGWERTPFHISRNELEVADVRRNDWHLVRLWNFAREPKAFALRPPLEAHIELTATSFLADLR